MCDDILDFDDDPQLDLLGFDNLLDDEDDILDFGDDLLDFDDEPKTPKELQIDPLSAEQEPDVDEWPEEASNLAGAGNNDFWHSPHPIYPNGYSQYGAFKWWYRKMLSDQEEGHRASLAKAMAWGCLVNLRAGRESYVVRCEGNDSWEENGIITKFYADTNTTEVLFMVIDKNYSERAYRGVQGNCKFLERFRTEQFDTTTGKPLLENSPFYIELDDDLLG